MSNLIVIVFDDEEQAGEVRESLRKQQKIGNISLDDSAVVVKDEDGQVHIKNEVDRGVKTGIAGGGLIGLFVGFVIGGPIGMMILGGLGGAAVGALTNMGLQKSFIKEVSAEIKPGTSSIFFIVRDANPNAAIATLRPYKGTVIQSSLTPEAEKELRHALKMRDESARYTPED
jgi:uncharacterized membrane protein